MNISDVEEGDFGLEDIDDSIFEFNKRYGAPVDCLWIITVRENWKVSNFFILLIKNQFFCPQLVVVLNIFVEKKSFYMHFFPWPVLYAVEITLVSVLESIYFCHLHVTFEI